MDFDKRLNYSLGNEDWSVEEQALQVKPGDCVICVTASGDRPMHLLMTDCKEILSLDMNRIQNYLLDLKMAAISQLDYEKYIDFLGCNKTKNRYDIFKQIKPHLSKDSANYWENNKKMIQRGIIYQGVIERLTYVLAKVIKLIRPKKNDVLFTFTDIDSQREYVEKVWDTAIWRKIFKAFLNSNSLKFVNDPGLSSFDQSIKPGNYIYQKMRDYLNNTLASESPLLQLIFLGKILPNAYFPYLTHVGYQKIRSNISRLKYQTTNIVEFLNTHTPNEIDVFSMSDIASYMPQEVFERLLQGIYNTAKPEARFCIREFMSKRQIPNEYIPHFKRDFKLEQKLEKEESNFVYRFMAGSIQK